jgi:CPA2 family monovalent cation:H+ antiporter-2
MGAAFVSYILGHTVHWSSTLGIFIVIAVTFIIIFSRRLRKESELLEKTFTDNLTQRERHDEQQAGRPQYMKGLVERDIHLSTFTVPVGIDWGGKTLAELALGKRYGVQVAGIQRGQQRINIPSAHTLILPGDRLQVIGSDKQLSDFGQTMETLTAKATMQETPEEMTLRRLVLFSDSPFVGKTIKESGIREHYQCLVVGVEDEGEEGLLMPDPMQLLRNGDIIWVVGEEANITQLEGSRHQAG